MIPNITPAPANRELPGIPGSLLPGRSADGWFGLRKPPCRPRVQQRRDAGDILDDLSAEPKFLLQGRVNVRQHAAGIMDAKSYFFHKRRAPHPLSIARV
jgi:hypothetical protein